MKKFERCFDNPEDKIYLAGYDVDIKNSEMLFSVEKFDDATFENCFDVKVGEWYVENGWIVGKNSKMCPGMIVSKNDFFGSVMVEITAKMVAPSTHDINIMINGEWNDAKCERGNAYVAGLEAFWHGNIGFEKSPEYKLTATTHLFDFDPDLEYNFKFGNIDGKIFVLVNNRLSLEITDPSPLDSNIYGKIGFEAFSSWWKFKGLRVYKINYEKITERYNPEF